MAEGAAQALVVSNHPEDTLGQRPVPCEEAARRPYPVYCFDPSPATTQGEARAFAELARVHGWRSVQVLTFKPQVTRARVLLGRCYDGDIRMLVSDEPYSRSEQLVYQTGAFIKVALTPGC